MAQLLVGSEGTLAFFNEIELELQPIPAHRVLGICHFPSFYSAMAATTAHRRRSGPAAVELVDRTMIELARDIPMFRPIVDRFVRGEPEAILLVEFAGDDPADNLPAPAGAGRADGRSRLSRRRRRGDRPRLPERGLGGARSRASTS